jgi:formylmethanofuran dehydrogenase subunit E
MEDLAKFLQLCAARYPHLCPRQVLGIRIAMLAGKILNLDLPQTGKRLFAFMECDGCGMGGVAVASGCAVEHRTMRVLDYGKLAATFVDTQTGQCVRIRPHPGCRQAAEELFPAEPSRWHSQLRGYQALPDETLLIVQPVALNISIKKIISQPGLRALCECCGEEISNQREITWNGHTLCRSCAGDKYYCPIAGEAGSNIKNTRLPVVGRTSNSAVNLRRRFSPRMLQRE